MYYISRHKAGIVQVNVLGETHSTYVIATYTKVVAFAILGVIVM